MDSLHATLFKLRHSIIHRGPRETVRHALHWIGLRLTRRRDPEHLYPVHPFDLQHGVDTSGLLLSVELAAHHPGSSHPHAVYTNAYHGTPPSRFRGILSAWQATPPQYPIADYTFIDIGCGKGRAVLLATELPFKEVLGVELSPVLAQIATNNLRLWHSTGHATRPAAGHPTTPARILCQDATELTLPPNPCLIYLYNPFAEQVVRKLIDHLASMLSAHPHPLDIVYFTPDSAHLFATHPNFTTLWSQSIPISPDDQAAEPVTDVADTCTAYRWTTNPQTSQQPNTDNQQPATSNPYTYPSNRNPPRTITECSPTPSRSG